MSWSAPNTCAFGKRERGPTLDPTANEWSTKCLYTTINTHAEINKWLLTQSACPAAWVWMRTRWECQEKPSWGEDAPPPEDWALWRQTQYRPFKEKATRGVNMQLHTTGFSAKKKWIEAYLCNIAMASLVLSWSRPKVREKRRASSLMPQKAEDERSKLGPRSDSISLNSCTQHREKDKSEKLRVKPVLMADMKPYSHWPAVSSEWVSLHTGFCRSVSSCS